MSPKDNKSDELNEEDTSKQQMERPATRAPDVALSSCRRAVISDTRTQFCGDTTEKCIERTTIL